MIYDGLPAGVLSLQAIAIAAITYAHEIDGCTEAHGVKFQL